MAQGREFDGPLLAEIRSRLERLSETQHQLARDHRILTDAATRLRLREECRSRLGRDQRAESGAAAGLLRHSAHPGRGASSIDWSPRGIGVKAGRRGNESEGGRGRGRIGWLRDCGVHGAAVHDPRRRIARRSIVSVFSDSANRLTAGSPLARLRVAPIGRGDAGPGWSVFPLS